MKIGFIGLGKMGLNMVQRLLNNGHEIVVWDLSKEAVLNAAGFGAISSDSIEELVSKLPAKKVIWLMVPSGKPVEMDLDALLKVLNANDIVIDGGNSYWKDTQIRAERAASKGVYYLDCGTSGGVWGLKNGYCLMYGGHKPSVEFVQPIFDSLAPQSGSVYCGESGSGHYAKMVHNGIEYGMMQAMAEGFELLEKSPFAIDLPKIADAWQYGSVIRSWLLELAADALKQDPKLGHLKAYVQDSGEGKWAVQTAMDLNVPAHVITASLFNRFQSRQDDSFAMKLLSALRNEFGGHDVVTKK